MRIVGFDTETGKTKDGLPAPPWACSTFAEAVEGADGFELVRSIEVDPRVNERRVGDLLEDDGVTLVGSYTAYDLVGAYEHWPDLRDLVFAKYDKGLVQDILLREKLLDMAKGTLPASEWVRFGGSQARYYGMGPVVLRRFGTDLSEDKKDPMAWRLRFNELRGVPREMWPDDAVNYALGDAGWPVLVHRAQHVDAVNLRYQVDGRPWEIPGEADRARASFALAIIAGWGVRTDGARVEAWAAELDHDLHQAQTVLLGDADGLRHAIDHAETPEQAEQLQRWLSAVEVEGFEKLARFKTEKGVQRLATSRKAVQARITRAKVAEALEELRPLHDGAELQVFEETREEMVQGKRDKAPKPRKVYRVYAAKARTPAPDLGEEYTPEILGEIPLPRTDTMQVATGAEFCDDIDDPILDAYVAYKAAEKNTTTYLPVVRSGVDRPICPTYDPLKITLRTGCDNPNLQNIPAQGRGRPCFRAREGHALVSIDLDGAELRSWSEVCFRMFGHSKMGDILNSGEDPHLVLTQRFPEYREMSLDDLKALKKGKDPHLKKRRDLAKIPNFSFLANAGPDAVQSNVKRKQGLYLSKSELLTLKGYFVETWEPEEYWNWGAREVGSFGGTTTIILPGSGVRVAGRRYTEVLNNPFQSLTGQAHSAGFYAAVKACLRAPVGSPLRWVRLCMQVHDEVLAEVPLEALHEGAYALRDVYLAACQPWFKHVQLTASPAAQLYWHKAADEVVDEEGRLQIWTP